jgi:hypothetical protein
MVHFGDIFLIFKALNLEFLSNTDPDVLIAIYLKLSYPSIFNYPDEHTLLMIGLFYGILLPIL